MLLKDGKRGIGFRFIMFSFFAYGALQLNYFLEVSLEAIGRTYPLVVPYYGGVIDIFLQSLMGLGMIISVLEIEQNSLRKANEELDTFLYRASHDLRAPLTTISGVVSAIKMTDDSEKKEEFLNAIQSRLLQADNVIRDIINLRQGQKMDLTISKVNLEKEIKKEFEALLSPQKPQPKLVVNTAEEEPVIYTDAARLHTILTNLLSNAIKYHDLKKDPIITVTIRSGANDCQISISDNGPGIDERHLPKIFDMFYRASMSSTGSGLGLYLVKDALAHIGGSISVSSEKGKGTTFHIYLKNLKPNHSSK